MIHRAMDHLIIKRGHPISFLGGNKENIQILSIVAFHQICNRREMKVISMMLSVTQVTILTNKEMKALFRINHTLTKILQMTWSKIETV